MHLNAASIIVLVILAVVAAAIRVIVTIKVSRVTELPRAARIVFILRTVFFFLVVAVGLDNYFLPSAWQFPAFGFKLFLALIGIWMSLMIAFPILTWRYRNAGAPKQSSARIR
ncbi:MAG: hypothetical protein ACYDDI_03535 [Candidatus Acidiferrales bacterium]